MLDLSSLKSAIAALERALNVAERKEAQAEEDEREVLRGGVIQAFEFSYELCWKFMRRWIETNLSPNAADGAPRRELFRIAVENALIDDAALWMRFNEARNIASHTYDLANAAIAFEAAKAFLPYARTFFANLEARL